MKKAVFGYQLGRDTKQRKALFKSLMNSLILHESITTTLTKAKAIRPSLEKLVTKAKNNNITVRRTLVSELGSENTTNKMLEVIGPAFKDRAGGYLRIIKLGARSGDNAEMVKVEFVQSFDSASAPKEAKTVKKVEAKATPKIKVTRKTRATKAKEDKNA